MGIIKKNNEIDNVLDECLERLSQGETVAECLAVYSDYASELEPLLQTALAAREAVMVLPREDFKARARYEFRAALHEEMGDGKARARVSLKRGWVTALMVISILFVSSGGTALAANDSMPDSSLYPVKLFSEQVQLIFIPSTAAKAEFCTTIAERRVGEIIYMASKGDAEQIALVTMHLGEDLDRLAALVAVPGEEAPYSGGVDTEAPDGTAEVEPPMLMTADADAAATQEAPAPENAPQESAADSAGVGNGQNGQPAATAPTPSRNNGDHPTSMTNDDGKSGDDVGVHAPEAPSAGNSDRENLKTIVVTQALNQQNALIEVFDNASSDVKDALYNALEVSRNGYQNVLANLG